MNRQVGPKQGIQRKMGLFLILITTFILVGFGLYQHFRDAHNITADINCLAEMTILRLADNLALPIWSVDDSQIEKVLLSEMNEKRIYSVLIRKNDGKKIAVRGIKRDDRWQLIETENDVSGNFIRKSKKIVMEGEELGVVEVCLTKKFMVAELKHEIIIKIVTIVFLDMSLLIAIMTIIRRNVIRPVRLVIAGFTESAEKIYSASAQISSASQSLSEGSCDQAASLEESSASLEEVSSMSRQNATNTENADRFTRKAGQVVMQAGNAMSAMTSAMEKISGVAGETHKIISMIDGITFQTNILALNAAVEAARAGEAGLGFAVVAEEVRTLAAKTADATKHTADLVEKIIRQVSDGTEFAIRTDAAFREVAAVSAGAAERISEITAVSKEQAQIVGQVNKGVIQVEKVTQQNAAHAQELAAVSEYMNAQAGKMKGFVRELAALVG